MPKRLLLVLTVLAAALAACNNGSSSPTPTAAPSVPLTPNPMITTAYVYTTFNGTPVGRVPVGISTPLNNNTASPRPGTSPFATVTTRPATAATNPATAVFKNINPNKTYCWQASIPAPTPTPLPPSATPSPTPSPGGPTPSPTPSPVLASQCAAPTVWQYTTIQLGT